MSRFRSAWWTLAALFALGAGCSSAPSENVEEGTEAFSTATWIDGNVASFKAVTSSATPGLVYVLGADGNLWREIGGMSNRAWVDGNVRDYQPIDGTLVYVLGADGKLWRENGSMASRTQVATGAVAFQVTTDGSGFAYTLDASGTLRLVNLAAGPTIGPSIIAYSVRSFQWSGATPQNADDGSCGASLYVLRTNGALWRGDVRYTFSEAQLEANVASFRAVGSMDYYAVTSDSKLWFEHNTNASRTLVDSSVQGVWGWDAHASFVEDASSRLWREEYSSRNRDLVDANVKAFQPADETSVYVLRKDGNLYLEQLAPSACNYTYAPRVCILGQQNETYVAAWGAQTLSGDCPPIPAATGTWLNMVGGAIPGVPTTATDSHFGDPPPPDCLKNGLPASCCWYVWWPKSGAIQDPSVLCTPNNAKLVAYDVCGMGHAKGGPSCQNPGGGGCASCRW